MFTEVDKILYTDRCEVIKFPSQRFVYPIFKNGSSTLYKEQNDKKLSIFVNNKIKRLDKIEIILRDPVERFASGYATFITHTLCNNPNLDKATVEYFASNYLFLDKHFMPQFLWLLNLSRFTEENCKLELYGMEHLSTLSNKHENFLGLHTSIANIKNLDPYIKLDNILYNLKGKAITWREIITAFKEQEPMLFKHVFREKDFNALF